MDFFRSILSDDPDPQTPSTYHDSDNDDSPSNPSPNLQEPDDSSSDSNTDPNSNLNSNSNSNINSSEDGSGIPISGGLWSFGDLVKTLTTKSESVFETYRRDLKEFGTGLRKESDLFREVASRAVKELPSSIEVGTSAAIDGVLKTISHGKESLLATTSSVEKRGLNSNSRRFSRFDLQMNAIQTDSRTYCEDPEDLDDYNKWKLGFVFGDKRDEIEKLVGENGVLAGIYSKLVPMEVEDATFWYRYFYKIYKFKVQADLRDKLVKRSLSADIEEELSWDVDDDENENDNDDEKEKEKEVFDRLRSNTSKSPNDDESKTRSAKIVIEDKEIDNANVGSVNKSELVGPKSEGGNGSLEKVEKSDKSDLVGPKSEGGNGSLKKVEKSEKVDEDEDLEWDEIEEDVGNNTDDKKVVSEGEIGNKDDLRKRLSTIVVDDDDEDLSWDIEDDDDDDDVKSGK